MEDNPFESPTELAESRQARPPSNGGAAAFTPFIRFTGLWILSLAFRDFLWMVAQHYEIVAVQWSTVDYLFASGRDLVVGTMLLFGAPTISRLICRNSEL